MGVGSVVLGDLGAGEMEFEMGLRVLGVGFRESLLEKRDRLRLDLRWIDKSGERREEAGEARVLS